MSIRAGSCGGDEGSRAGAHLAASLVVDVEGRAAREGGGVRGAAHRRTRPQQPLHPRAEPGDIGARRHLHPGARGLVARRGGRHRREGPHRQRRLDHRPAHPRAAHPHPRAGRAALPVPGRGRVLLRGA